MSETREKTLSYRRAHWIDGPGVTLEQLVKSAHNKLPDVADRSVFHGDHCMRSMKTKPASGGILLHLTGETPGEFASVVPKPGAGKAELDLKAQQPPEDGEWLDGDAFLFIKDDHVCLCTTGFRDAAIRHFLSELFEKAKLGEKSKRFILVKQADIKASKLLQQQGVKEIQIRAALYKATADFQRRKASTMGVLGAAGKYFKAMLDKPNDVSPDGLRVFLTLKTDRRFGGVDVGEKHVQSLAADILKHSEDDDEFVIVTKQNQKITSDEIFMRRKVDIETDGKTVNCDKAWLMLTKFFGSLTAAGILEQ